MPRYDYYCKECDKVLVISHSYKDPVKECPKCTSPHMEKVLSAPIKTHIRNTKSTSQVGSVVKEFIKTSKENTVQQKKELLKRKNK